MEGSKKSTLRIGVLGAAKITPMALMTPVRRMNDVEVVAVAARSEDRAAKFARRHRIPNICASYEELVQHEDIDAIYNPLPNSHHAYWSIEAMRAGKHVLCEKPIASNSDEASKMQEIAEAHNRILMEAFHWRYHPLAVRAIELIRSNVIGKIKHIDAKFCVPIPFINNIRYSFELAGGGLMDTGCYTVSMLRHLAGVEPEVTHASAKTVRGNIDRFMEADLVYPNGATAGLRCSIWAWPLLSVHLEVRGETGRMNIMNPVAPHILYHHLKIRSPQGQKTERFWGQSTYQCQLNAFKDAIARNEPPITDGRDGILNMKVIDAIYRKAGMKPRAGLFQ